MEVTDILAITWLQSEPEAAWPLPSTPFFAQRMLVTPGSATRCFELGPEQQSSQIGITLPKENLAAQNEPVSSDSQVL
jgi:hypothetical protein